MPAAFLLVADFGAVAAAILCTLLAIAVVFLLKMFAAVFGKINLGIVSFDVGTWFAGIFDSGADWIVRNTKSAWVHVATLLYATAWIFDHTLSAAVSAIDHAFDYADHIVTQTIPNAIDTAVGESRTIVNNTVTDLANEIRDGSDAVGLAVAAVAAHALTDAKNYADADVATLKRYVDDQIGDAEAYADRAVAALSKTLGGQISTLAGAVATDFTDAKNDAQADATAALNTAKGLITSAITETENVAQADATKVQNLLQAAIDGVSSTVSSLTTTVGNDFTATEQYARTQVAQAVSTVTGTLDTAINTVNGAISSASAAAAAGISTAIQAAQGDANTALSDASTALGNALAGVTQDITGTAQAFDGDLTSTEGLLAGAITAAIAGVAVRVTHLEECSVGVCSDSQNPFSSVLKDALDLVEVAGVGGFLAELIDDPSRAISEYSGAISGIVSTGESAFDTLLSL